MGRILHNFQTSHNTYALVLGRINKNAASKKEIANAKVKRIECDAKMKISYQHTVIVIRII